MSDQQACCEHSREAHRAMPPYAYSIGREFTVTSSGWHMCLGCYDEFCDRVSSFRWWNPLTWFAVAQPWAHRHPLQLSSSSTRSQQ